MTTEAKIGHGVHLARGDGASPQVFTNVAELIDLSTPSMTKDQVEATHTDSTDGFREFIPGPTDGGEFSATMNFIPGNATQGNRSEEHTSELQSLMRISSAGFCLHKKTEIKTRNTTTLNSTNIHSSSL